MLSHLRRRVVETLTPVRRAVLSTCGPADIQAAEVDCCTCGTRLYMLLPQTSDLLYNLEHHAAVVVSGPQWQLHGKGYPLDASQWPVLLGPPQYDDWRWMTMVEVRPTRLYILDGPQGAETIDFDEDGSDGLC